MSNRMMWVVIIAWCIAMVVLFAPSVRAETVATLSCEGFVQVKVMDDADLEINGVHYDLVSSDNSGTMYYGGGVELVGVLRLDVWELNGSTLHYSGRDRLCYELVD